MPDTDALPTVNVELPMEETQEPPPMLGISEERLAAITSDACQQLTNFRTQIGLDQYPVGGSGGYPVISQVGREGTWVWQRQCARMSYAGAFYWRRALGGVWLENGPQGGWTLNASKRFVDSLATKAEDDILGSDVFFSSMPENIKDPQQAKLSKQVEAKVQTEVQQSNVRQVLAESIRVALTEGERCVKLTHQVDKTQYVGDAEVLIDPTTNEPFKTPNGDYIFKKDNVLVIIVDIQGNFLRVADGVTPLAVDQQTGQPAEFVQVRLEKEPAVIMPENASEQFELRTGLILTITHKNGLEADGLFPEDFIYDIYVPRLSEAKLMAHVYDMKSQEILDNYPSGGYGARRAAMNISGPMSQASQPIERAGEQLKVSYPQDLVCIHETYYRLKVNPEDEHESWLFLVIDMTNRLPIYAEYLGNMKMKRPPFGLIRGLRGEPGRAYGVGIYQDFKDQHLAIDLTFNRLCLKDSKEGSVTFVNGAMIKEVQEGHKLIIGGKEYYNLNPAYPEEMGPKNPPVFRINLNEMTGDAWEIIDKLMTTGVLNYGIVNFSELSDTSAPISKGATATATRNIERTGNTLQRSMQRTMAYDVLNIMDFAVDIILENSDPEELLWVPGEMELATLNRDEIRNLQRDVRLTLTRSKGAEAMETNAQATELIFQYYQLTMALRKTTREFFVNRLRALDVQDASEVLKEPTEQELAAEQQAQTPPETRESLAISLKDIGMLTPYERSQILAKFGITASPPEEVVAMEMQEKQMEAAQKEREAELRVVPKHPPSSSAESA